MDKAAFSAAMAALKPEIVHARAHDVEFFVKELDKAENVHMLDKWNDEIESKRGNAWVLCCTLCDEAGKRLYADADAGEIAAWPDKLLRSMFQVAARINGLRDDDIEELEKN